MKEGDSMTKPLAKSLHTITVLVNVARHLEATAATIAVPSAGWPGYVTQATRLLGLDDKPDVYGLADAAIKQLEK
jgi:hypothetical protein